MKTATFFLLALLILIGSVAVVAQDQTEPETVDPESADPEADSSEGEDVPESEEPVDNDEVEPDNAIGPDTSVGSVTKFYLWDASVPKQVVEITNGKKWCPGNLSKFSIEAKVSGIARSVYMKLTGPVSVARTENAAPWFLGGNDGLSKIYPVNKPLKNGSYELTSIPYEKHHKGGRPGRGKTIRFTIDCAVICRRC